MERTAIAIAVGLFLGGCSAPISKQADTPVAAVTPAALPAAQARLVPPNISRRPEDMYLNYAAIAREQIGLLQAFDDSRNTYLQFASPAPNDLTVTDQQGNRLRVDTFGSYAVVPGVHAGMLITTPRGRTYIAAANADRPAQIAAQLNNAFMQVTPAVGFERLVATPVPLTLPAATDAAAANSRGLAAARAQIANAELKLKGLSAEIERAGKAGEPFAAVISQLEQVEAHVNGLAATLVRVRFANGGSVLEVNDQARSALASAGRAAKQIIVKGRTDSTGDPEINKEIAWARAASAKRLLVTEGVPANKIALHWRANADYVASNATPEGRAANRRVEFFFVGEAGQRIRVALNDSAQALDAAPAGALQLAAAQ